jgi:capsular polysaccharide biosynthesis protein
MKEIYHKVKKRGLNTLRKLIHYNRKYKPSKAYALSKEYCQSNKHITGLECIELYPDYTTSLEVPENFLKAIPPYCLYDQIHPEQHSTLTVTTNYIIVALPNGRIYSNNTDMVAVIASDNVLLGDVSLQYLPDRIAKAEENPVFKQNYFIAPVKYKGVVFNMLAGGGPVNNYGHWLVDVLPRVHLLKKSGWFDRVNWFVVPNYRHDFQKDSLKLLGIREEQIILGSDQLHITADVVISSSAPRGVRSYLMPQWLAEFHRSSYLNQIPATARYAPRVYISRRDGTTRKVLNEEKFIELLKKYNFQIIELSKLSFIEKINLFHHARVLVSVVGAAFSNLVYCQQGTKALEIFPEVLVDTFDYNLATLVGVEYNYLICRSGVQTKKLTKATNTDMMVDLAEAERVIAKMCKEVKEVL